MTKRNPSNPYTKDDEEIKRQVPMGVAKAKVEAAPSHSDGGFHTISIRVYGESSQYDAPVLPFTVGSAWIPKPNTDVAVIFGGGEKPFVVGPWYAPDRVEDGEVDIPDYVPGEVVLGNGDGDIRIDNRGRVYINGEEAATGGHTRYTDEEAQDATAALLSSGSHLTETYDDANDILTLDVSDDWVDSSGDTMTGPLDMSGNTVDNRSGFLDAHLTTTQTSMESGGYVNTFDSVNINDGPYTKDSNSQVSVTKGGLYRINYTVNFHRTGSGARNIMYGEVEHAGVKLSARSRGVCYIREAGAGDEGDASAEVIVNATSGDTIRLYAAEERGAETGNDVERANIDIEYLG